MSDSGSVLTRLANHKCSQEIVIFTGIDIRSAESDIIDLLGFSTVVTTSPPECMKSVPSCIPELFSVSLDDESDDESG
ncbi:hypothetical protein DdX_20695 [Ditylenchus destructor]|uniref:Uncharacterized protein n=1 Tax=Ditylenchus destructor TaxID=166010 RepID=A0AAD4QTG9_9BILA|nr:hypothetical protein DdX_20695 [Ditylenchus destructor]